MESITKKLILAFFIVCIAKIILSTLVPTPTIFTDEYIYMKMSQSFSQNFNFDVHSMPTLNYHPLYPIILSIAFIFDNAIISYFLMKILNAIVSSLIIIPSYLLAREFVSRKKAFLCSIIISLMPMNLAFTPFIMAENMFYVLFKVLLL